MLLDGLLITNNILEERTSFPKKQRALLCDVVPEILGINLPMTLPFLISLHSN